MSLLLAFLHWLFGRRLSADERYRVWAVDHCGWLLRELQEGWFSWGDPEDRAWLIERVRRVEKAAFWWSPRRCAHLQALMLCEVDAETLVLRICEASKVLLGERTKPFRGKGCKIRKGRKFLHRKKLVAWRAKWRRFAKHPLHRAERGPPPPILPRSATNC
jgi:hypothetical protein